PAGSTSIPLMDNSQQGPIPLGFTFNFFGNDFTDVYIGSNAIIGFSAGVTTPINQSLPNAGAPNNIIALAWDEMTPSPGPIEYFVTGRAPFRKFVVNYAIYRDSNPLYTVQTQVQLHETTNIIEIHSTNINIAANFATMGIEDATGTVAVPVPGRNNQPFTAVNDYVAFIPDCVDIRYVTVSEAPTTADAGVPSIEQCNTGTFAMAANTPTVGTGTWTVQSGTATITNPTSPTTTVTGIAAGTSATLRWTIDNGVCAETFDDIVLTNHALPSAATAGSDQEQCNDGTFTMGAAVPAIGTGTWSIVSGSGNITNPSLSNTTVTAVAAGTSLTLRWTVTNGNCVDNTDDVVITNSDLPDTADAGAEEIEQCNNGTFFMSANIPSTGTGQWTLVAGSATIVNPNSPTTTITNVAAGSAATLRWIITNGSCGSTSDD